MINSGTVLTKNQVRSAFLVAVVTDVLQLPIVLGMFGASASIFGAFADLPLEGLDVALDLAAAVIINRLLGFHWILLPTVLTEAVPGLDAIPSWTMCVAWVVRQRRAQGRIATKAAPDFH